MAAPEISATSPAPSNPKSYIASSAASPPAYDRYFRLPDLAALWTSKDFPQWTSESLIKPPLQALEITFRLISLALSDSRPYANPREWSRRLESLAMRQLEIIGSLCADEDGGGGAPISDLTSSAGVIPRDRSSLEVWQAPGEPTLVSRASEASLLPRLAAWEKSADVAAAISFQIEAQMRRCAFTLGLGEPNLAAKPALEFDRVVRPSELHALKRSSATHEDQALCTIHQILESWIHAAGELVTRLEQRIDAKNWIKAASDCWLLERVWKLLSDAEDLHMLMDPDDFLRLKSELGIRAATGSEAFCFRSAALLRVTSACKELRRWVPWVLDVEADPEGGPRVQDSAMRLFHGWRRGEEGNRGRVELLQAMQAVEAAVRRFYFGYRHLVAALMGSVEASGNRAVYVPEERLDALSQMFLEPPYFPSLDGAKTFLGEFWLRERSKKR